MGMNLVRSGGALGIGVLSAGAGKYLTQVQPITLGTFTLKPDGMAEVAGLVVGAAMQQWAPLTQPDLVDGVVDGALALIGRRVVTDFLPAPASHMTGRPMNGAIGAPMTGAPMGAPMGAPRAQVGSVGGLTRNRVS